MVKNTMAKTRPVDRPYEIWRAGSWEWRVLKKWQVDDRKPFARWFCSVSSPYTMGGADLGDCYASDIMREAVLVHTDYDPPRVCDGEA